MYFTIQIIDEDTKGYPTNKSTFTVFEGEYRELALQLFRNNKNPLFLTKGEEVTVSFDTIDSTEDYKMSATILEENESIVTVKLTPEDIENLTTGGICVIITRRDELGEIVDVKKSHLEHCIAKITGC